MTDQISLQRLAGLHPKFRPIAEAAYAEACEALTGRATLRIAYGVRTWAEQGALYAKGRTAPGPKVTNAAPGQSMHNYGLAVDIVLIIDGQTASWDILKDFDGDREADWMEVVRIFKAHGMKWGGDFATFKDRPHFEMSFGKSIPELLRLHNQSAFISGTKFVNI